LIYGFWSPLWYLLITPLVSSDHPFGIFWSPLWYLLTFLQIDTFQSCDLISYKDSGLDLSKFFQMTTWLRGFLCQFTNRWWVKSNWSVISCGLPTSRFLKYAHNAGLASEIFKTVTLQNKGQPTYWTSHGWVGSGIQCLNISLAYKTYLYLIG
jgi:hypothetical protein